MEAYLPHTDGWLPYYVLFVGLTALGNTVQCYSTMSYTQRLYAGPPSPSSTVASKTTKPGVSTSPATPLSSRTFGTWCAAVGIVRIFAAYHIHEASWYQMNMLTNVIGLVHFSLEAFVYKTARPYGPWLAPMIVAFFGLAWSAWAYDFYVT